MLFYESTLLVFFKVDKFTRTLNKTMKFRTELPHFKANFALNYQTPTLGIGSCFVENIGEKMLDRRLPFYQNPFGIVYNPLSIAAQLDILMSEKQFINADLVEINGRYHSWLHHGFF